MNDWSFAIGTIAIIICCVCSYIKGLDEGMKIKNEQIEDMIVKAIEKFDNRNKW